MTTRDCPSCGTPSRLTPAGICLRCRDELRFVVRPAAHREAYRRRLATQEELWPDLEQLGFVMIASLPADNSLWICDLCNSRIPVSGEYTLIPMVGSYALCGACVPGFAFWPTGWTKPTPLACRCSACQTPLLAVVART